MHFNKYSFTGNRNTLTADLNWAKQTVSQSSSVEKDASLKAGEGHRPPLPQGQGWEADEQQGDAGKKFKTSLTKPVFQLETQGTDMKSLKHHVGIQPLFIIFGCAITFVSSFVSLVDCVGRGCAIVR